VLVLMLLQLKQRVILAPILALVVVLTIAYAPASWKHRMDPTSPDVMDASAQERLNSWSFSRNLAADYPIAGGGFDTFTSPLFARYAPHGNDIHGPHSVYFQVLAEHGYVGLIIYVALICTCSFGLFQVARQAKRLEQFTILEYARMLQLSFVGFLASGVFLGRAYFDYFFSIVACVVILRSALQQITDEESNEIEDAEDATAGETLLSPQEA